MKALDFEYDGILASEKGYVPCDFNDTTSDQTVNYHLGQTSFLASSPLYTQKNEKWKKF